MGQYVVSFSVYGDDLVYSSGAIANAIAVRQFFPGWIARFYVEDLLADRLGDRLLALGADVVAMRRQGNVDGMFWRFLAAGDDDIDAVIVRDVDALVCPRNKFVVDEWLQSGKDFHIVRDHPHHRHLILGGLWGVRGGVLPSISELIDAYRSVMGTDEYGDDIRFLSRTVYPLVASNALIHSDFVAFADEVVTPIVAPRLNFQWLGFPPARGEISDLRQQNFRLLADQGLQRYEIPQSLHG